MGSDADIERMVKEAESMAGADAEKKAKVETRNEADTTIYNTEKTLLEHEAKVPQGPGHDQRRHRGAQGGARRRQHLVGGAQGEGGGAQAELHEDRRGYVQERRHRRHAGGRDGGAQEGGEERGREEVRRRGLLCTVLVVCCCDPYSFLFMKDEGQ